MCLGACCERGPNLAEADGIPSNSTDPFRIVQEVGATSGRVLDEIIRHADVLGMEGFTRSDALESAEYKNDFKQYKCGSSRVQSSCTSTLVPKLQYRFTITQEE